jgi:putative phosphoserine phosphatase / 1-acylglycerol-3-phosphate O-acyltransferase
MASTTIKETNDNNYIAFFDLDRTITKAISGRALARESLKRGLLKTSDLVIALYSGLSYRLHIGDPVDIMEKMTGWVKGLPEQTLIDICQDVFRKVMLPSVYPAVIDEIKMHKTYNAKTVILSSTVVPICSAMAEYLEMDDIICSELEIIEGHLTGRPLGKLCYGEEKLSRLKDYCERNNTSPSDAWYYGDALIDRHALSIVGNPVCINPDKKLLKVARKNNWKIYYWSK